MACQRAGGRQHPGRANAAPLVQFNLQQARRPPAEQLFGARVDGEEKRDNEWVLEEQAVEMLALEDQKARQRVKLVEARERARAQTVQGMTVATNDVIVAAETTTVVRASTDESETVEEALRKLVERVCGLMSPSVGSRVYAQVSTH